MAIAATTATQHRPSGIQPAASIFSEPRAFWLQNREASLNWLAFGLLLAAWNAAGDDATDARVRPEALRGYSAVSVRAAAEVIKPSTNCKASCL